MKLLKLFFILSSLFLLSCSFAPKPIRVTILPIILGVDIEEFQYNQYDYIERIAISKTKNIFESNFNLEFEILDYVYSPQHLTFECEDWNPPPTIDTLPLINQCYRRLITIVLIHPNLCSNLLGCAPGSSIAYGPTQLMLYIDDDSIYRTTSVLTHELAHIFGAEHTLDDSIMCPLLSQMKNPKFSEESIKQINELLEYLKNNT